MLTAGVQGRPTYLTHRPFPNIQSHNMCLLFSVHVMCMMYLVSVSMVFACILLYQIVYSLSLERLFSCDLASFLIKAGAAPTGSASSRG